MQSPEKWKKVKEQLSLEFTYSQKNDFMDTLIEEDELLYELHSGIAQEVTHCENMKYTRIAVDESKDYEYCFDRLTRKLMYIMMECPKASIQQYIGSILHMFEGDEGECLEMADTLMTRIADTDIIDFQPKYDGLNVIVNFHLSPETMAELGQYDKPLPSVCPLDPITHNYSQAYQSISTGSILLGKGSLKHHELPLDYMAINTAQSIPFSLNEDFAMGVPYVKDHSGVHPKARAMAKLNFANYVVQQRAVHQILLDHGNCFYLPHKRDARLRSNAQGKFVNYQKDAFHKAALDFQRKEYVSGF